MGPETVREGAREGRRRMNCRVDGTGESERRMNELQKRVRKKIGSEVKLTCTTSGLPALSFLKNWDVTAVGPTQVDDGGRCSPAPSSESCLTPQIPVAVDECLIVGYFCATRERE